MEYSKCYPLLINEFAHDDKKALDYIQVKYTQEADCSERCDDCPEQTLILETRDGGGGKFINIKTGDNGWSLDVDEDTWEKDLIGIIKDFKSRLTINSIK